MEADSFDVFLGPDEIDEIVGELAGRINRTYDSEHPILVVGVLKGAFIFLADLVRKLEVDVTLDFLQASSYEGSTTSTGNVELEQELSESVDGKQVLLVEDIVDTGRTLNRLIQYVRRGDPKSVKLCSLLKKPAREEISVDVDFLGTTVPDRFVVGYGLDYRGRYRQLPYIAFLPEEKTD